MESTDRAGRNRDGGKTGPSRRFRRVFGLFAMGAGTVFGVLVLSEPVLNMRWLRFAGAAVAVAMGILVFAVPPPRKRRDSTDDREDVSV